MENWDDLELLWNHVWDKESRSRNNINVVNGESDSLDENKVLVSVPPLCPPGDWRRMGEILLVRE